MKYRNLYSPLFLLLALLLLASCGPSGNGDGPGSSTLSKPSKTFFEDTWSKYLNVTLEQAMSSSSTLATKTGEFCGGTGSRLDDLKNGWKSSYLYILRQDFFDLIPQYKLISGTGTLRQKLLTPAAPSSIETFLTNHATAADVTEDEVTKKKVWGYPVVEYLLYGPEADKLKPNSNRCELLKVVTKLASKDVTDLQTEWSSQHETIFAQKRAFKELLEHYRRLISRLNERGVAAPSARSALTGKASANGVAQPKMTLAPYAKLGGWFVEQTLIGGLQKYYEGNYESNKFTVSLHTLIEKNHKTLDGKITEKFQAVKDSLQPFIATNQGTGTLESAVVEQENDKALGTKIERLIANMNELFELFKVDVPQLFGIQENASNGDGD